MRLRAYLYWLCRSRTFTGIRFNKEARIRTFGVGLIALATVAAASLLLRRRHVVAQGIGRETRLVDSLYAAGL